MNRASVSNWKTTSSTLFKNYYKPVVKMEIALPYAALPKTGKLLLVVWMDFELTGRVRNFLTMSAFLVKCSIMLLS
jgi:hypothetical protein